MKKIFSFLFLTLITGSLLYGADPLLGGQEAMKTAGKIIQAWQWIISLGIVGLGFVIVGIVFFKTKQKEENDTQFKTSTTKLAGILLLAFIIAETVLFLVLGVGGKVFLGMSFTDTWDYFVIKPLRALLGLQ